MLDVYDEFKAIIAALHERGIEYAVCGGLAMAVHGLARATVDIDLLIEEDAVEPVKAAIKPLGYWIEAQPMSFAKRAVEIHRISKLDSETGIVLSLELLLVTPQIRSVWESRILLQSAEGSFWVVSASGLYRGRV